ncbi:MAG: TAT-variant-translocated molybdopterin oxidoreductase [Blastocatellales bacterium]
MSRKRYWKSLEEYRGDAALAEQSRDEFPAPLEPGVSRRAFIELAGLAATAVALLSCKAPEQKIIPYVKQPVELTPGVANWYATTCGGCSAACGALARVCDGRPVKLEGNPEHPLSGGGLCAAAHAEVFNLYYAERLRQPLSKGKAASWEEIDSQVGRQLAAIRQSGGKVRLLTPFINSPTSQLACESFQTRFVDTRHVVYQSVSTAAIIAAHERTHLSAGLPDYHFEKAKLAVSFAADFLGTWGAPAPQMRAYSQARDLRGERKEMLRHIQFESMLSLTGSNADRRVMIAPAEGFDALLYLAKLIAAKNNSGAPLAAFEPKHLSASVRQTVEKTAEELQQHRGESLVVCGWNDVDAQSVVNFINHTLGNYGHTISTASGSEYVVRQAASLSPAVGTRSLAANEPTSEATTSWQLVEHTSERSAAPAQGGEQQMADLVKEMNDGQVAALIIVGSNPVYSYHDNEALLRGLDKTPLKIALNSVPDETASVADYVCPVPHFLETWGDAMPARGVYSLTQPTIAPIFNTRPWQQSLLKWSGDARNYYDFLRTEWREKLFPRQSKYASFDEFWDRSLHDGVFVVETAPEPAPSFIAASLNGAAERLSARSGEAAGKLSLALYQKVTLRDGASAANPWLQELPDPLTKITWDNYVNVAPKLAEKMLLAEGDMVRLSKGATAIELPVHIQPGQHEDCVSVALGYGRTKAGKVGSNVGANAYPFVAFANGGFQYETSGVTIEKTGSRVEFAKTQTHDSNEGRELVKELTIAAFRNAEHHNGDSDAEKHQSMWPGHEFAEHKWGMVIDLNACTGCSACLLSCQAENNVPVVGKDEVRRRREMHWIRIDRYYEGSPDDPRVAYQPMTCEQCENASCESVCPVLATVHSGDGLNMQVYNRCVGTRYCANNCAFKVRRFNWFDYAHNDALANLALNPDVTVRSRGVMEKCSFCVQRIEEVKIRSRNENRPIRDGEIQTACQQSCPASAITFGNLLDVESRVAQLKRDGRNYALLEELNLQPALSYLAKVRNEEET